MRKKKNKKKKNLKVKKFKTWGKQSTCNLEWLFLSFDKIKIKTQSHIRDKALQ